MTDTLERREADEYVIRKDGYYYRPNAQDYTPSIHEAGRYSLADAIRLTHPNGPDGPRDGLSYMPAPAALTPSPRVDEGRALELARAIVKRHYPEMPADYSGRRVKIVLDALATTPADPRVGKIEAALRDVRAWVAALTVTDMNEIVADGGITAGMVVGQEATEQLRRIDRALSGPSA